VVYVISARSLATLAPIFAAPKVGLVDPLLATHAAERVARSRGACLLPPVIDKETMFARALYRAPVAEF
jgi:hypothetical protein